MTSPGKRECTLLVRDFNDLLDLMNLLDDSNGNSLEEIMNAERQDQHEASSCRLELFLFIIFNTLCPKQN